jgi:hypothetical protein
MSISMPRLHIHAACPYPICLFKSMQQVLAACPCCLSMHAVCQCNNNIPWFPSTVIIQYFDAKCRCRVRIRMGMSLWQMRSYLPTFTKKCQSFRLTCRWMVLQKLKDSTKRISRLIPLVSSVKSRETLPLIRGPCDTFWWKKFMTKTLELPIWV